MVAAAMVLVTLRSNSGLGGPEPTYLIWVDYLRIGQFVLLIMAITETVIVHQLIRVNKVERHTHIACMVTDCALKHTSTTTSTSRIHTRACIALTHSLARPAVVVLQTVSLSPSNGVLESFRMGADHVKGLGVVVTQNDLAARLDRVARVVIPFGFYPLFIFCMVCIGYSQNEVATAFAVLGVLGLCCASCAFMMIDRIHKNRLRARLILKMVRKHRTNHHNFLVLTLYLAVCLISSRLEPRSLLGRVPLISPLRCTTTFQPLIPLP